MIMIATVSAAPSRPVPTPLRGDLMSDPIEQVHAGLIRYSR